MIGGSFYPRLRLRFNCGHMVCFMSLYVFKYVAFPIVISSSIQTLILLLFCSSSTCAIIKKVYISCELTAFTTNSCHLLLSSSRSERRVHHPWVKPAPLGWTITPGLDHHPWGGPSSDGSRGLLNLRPPKPQIIISWKAIILWLLIITHAMIGQRDVFQLFQPPPDRHM